MLFIDASDIEATMKASRLADLTQDGLAMEFAVDKTNAEIYTITGQEYESLDDVPANLRSLGGIIGRYWLYSYNEALDNEGHIGAEYKEALRQLQEIAAGNFAGLDDPDSDTGNPVQSSSNDRYFDLEDWGG